MGGRPHCSNCKTHRSTGSANHTDPKVSPRNLHSRARAYSKIRYGVEASLYDTMTPYKVCPIAGGRERPRAAAEKGLLSTAIRHPAEVKRKIRCELFQWLVAETNISIRNDYCHSPLFRQPRPRQAVGQTDSSWVGAAMFPTKTTLQSIQEGPFASLLRRTQPEADASGETRSV